MQPIQRQEILSMADYEQIRPHFRARVIEDKKRRRMVLSDIMSATFENRDTVLLQIQEMMRTERITNEPAVMHEITTYNELIPGENQISFTLFIEIAEKEERERMLEALAGLEQKVFVEVNGERYPARSKDRTVEGYSRTTAVHYFKADLSPEAHRALCSTKAEVWLVVDHEAHPLRAQISGDALRALAADFA